MAAEDMTIDEALVIAEHANRHPAHVKHAALRVLAQAYKVERTRVAELEQDNAAMVRHLDALEDPEVADDEVPHLRARVAELEAERSGMRATEWGVRYCDGTMITVGQEDARLWALLPDRELVSRTAPGPWRSAT